MGGCSRAHWKAATAWLSMTSNIAVILSLFLLDVRDLYYKIAWIGPSESFAFRMGSTSILHSAPLQISPARDIRLQSSNGSAITPMDSGWPSFLARCEHLHALGADGGPFFLSAMGANCTLGEPSDPPISRLIMTSDQRVDAVVWASCSMLRVSQRPPICYERIVSDFYDRYRFKGSDAPSEITPVTSNSSAETELLRLLAMVSDSFPLHQVICVEAFVLADKATPISLAHASTIFGCGSPSAFRSEFVGMHNPGIAELLDRMAWLTADAITVMSMRYLIRQNCFSRYDIHEHLDDGGLVLQSRTTANFSSFGQLYALLIVIDLTLLTLNCLSSLELIQWMSFPKYKDVRSWAEHKVASESRGRPDSGHVKRATKPRFLAAAKMRLVAPKTRAVQDQSIPIEPIEAEDKRPSSTTRQARRRRLLATMEAMSGVAAIEEEQLYSFFSRSLYRNPRIVLITLVTQLMSWLLVLPNAVVWTWSDSLHEKLQAYLSSIRCWVLLLILCNTLWGGVVRISEQAAYAITKRTFLTSIDLIVVASFVSFMLRSYVFSMSEVKWSVEKQRVTDTTSFVGGYLAHGNTFHGALDSIDMTPRPIFAILYTPLVRILFTGVGVAMLLLAAKAAYFSQQRRVLMRRAQRQVAKQIAQLSRRLSKDSNSALDSSASGMAMGIASLGSHSGVSDTDEDDDEYAVSQEKALLQALSEPYQRLPLEEWLDRPIRATSLIRNGLRMETVRDTTRFIRPSCYLDFGIIVKRGVIHSRIGFSDSWQAKMTVQEYMTRVERQDPLINALVPPSAGIVDPAMSYRRLNGVGEASQRVGSSARVASRADLKRKQSLHVPLS